MVVSESMVNLKWSVKFISFPAVKIVTCGISFLLFLAYVSDNLRDTHLVYIPATVGRIGHFICFRRRLQLTPGDGNEIFDEVNGNPLSSVS